MQRLPDLECCLGGMHIKLPHLWLPQNTSHAYLPGLPHTAERESSDCFYITFPFALFLFWGTSFVSSIHHQIWKGDFVLAHPYQEPRLNCRSFICQHHDFLSFPSYLLGNRFSRRIVARTFRFRSARTFQNEKELGSEKSK